jgi:hypothetical protein
METKPNLADCPGCGRFIGPAMSCPYCGADAGGRLPLRICRWLAVLLGVGGLALLYMAAVRHPVPVVRIGDLGPTMNYAVVKIGGVAGAAPYIARDSDPPDYVSFPVDDGTGRITVFAGKPLAARLVAQSLLPARGDALQVTGTLALNAGGKFKLRLQSAAQLKVASAATGGQSTAGSSGREGEQ